MYTRFDIVNVRDMIFQQVVMCSLAENNQPVTRRRNLVAEDPESMTEAERCDLAFDQPLGRLRQCPLRLPNTYRERTAFGLAGLHQ